jgi:hypothetical protein
MVTMLDMFVRAGRGTSSSILRLKNSDLVDSGEENAVRSTGTATRLPSSSQKR